MADFLEMTDGVARIRTFGEEHLTQRYVDWLNDPEVVRYSERRHKTHTLESSRRYYETEKASANSVIAVEVMGKEPAHVGNMRVFVNSDNNFASLSILIGDKSCWGTGVASRAWQLALDALLNQYRFRLVIAATMDVNEPMVKLMRRSGMTVDGVLPKRFFWEGREVGMLWASKSLSA